ncbi:hypothetical protein G9409_02730 [Chlorobium sp. BLA1]|uniref:hypothetical protein n=1 Tax=Candidatus Chlorobium masyuteum TaxID=2716876 RepID=UPI001422E1A5|nr:hypothetical protein [Candidatus Chlorobium masyuteum]NHQ59516.1 hypothetical protein [Candidatus Chlorobium masyuteum]NTU45186.1 hypothetical protein [Chlorobiaceae bacterium]
MAQKEADARIKINKLLEHYNRLVLDVSKKFTELGESSRKIRRSWLLASSLLLVIDPKMSITLGSLSTAGIGAKLEPSVTFSSALVLLLIVIYLAISFWISVLTNTWTDQSHIGNHLRDEYDPDHDIIDPKDISDISTLIDYNGDIIRHQWRFIRIAWDIYFPSIWAIIAISALVVRYYLTS